MQGVYSGIPDSRAPVRPGCRESLSALNESVASDSQTAYFAGMEGEGLESPALFLRDRY